MIKNVRKEIHGENTWVCTEMMELEIVTEAGETRFALLSMSDGYGSVHVAGKSLIDEYIECLECPGDNSEFEACFDAYMNNVEESYGFIKGEPEESDYHDAPLAKEIHEAVCEFIGEN